MRSRRQVGKNPAPKASKRRKPRESAAQPAPPNRIRELRRRARLSLQDLSERTGEPLQTLARWETKGGLTMEKLARVARALRAAPSDLVAGAAPKGHTPDETFLLDRFAAASPQTRTTILRIVRALTDD